MTTKSWISLATTLAVLLAWQLAARAGGSAALALVGTIGMAGVEGRIDHMAATPDGRRLFVAALGSDRVLQIDIQAAQVTGVITGVKEPQGVCYLPKSRKLVVASGGDGMVRIYDDALKLAGTLSGLDDADNVRYDPDANLVYVGYGQGALAVIDPDKTAIVGKIPLHGHPESFQLENHGTRIFVNVQAAGEIEVFDRATRTVLARWPLKDAAANFPMALDEPGRRLFVGTRKPARMMVMDTAAGNEVAILNACGDTDDIFYDASRKRIYLSGGEGCVDVFRPADSLTYERLATVRTLRGARTSLLVPAAHRLYVAVPHRGAQPAELIMFATGN